MFLKGEINDVGTQEFCKFCWPSCTQIEYFADTTGFPLRDDVDLWKTTSTSTNISGQSNWYIYLVANTK